MGQVLQLIRDGDAVQDPDRLPWLADEPAPPRERRGFPLLLWPLLAVVLVAGLSFWLGTSGPLWPNFLRDIAETSPAAPAEAPRTAANQDHTVQQLPLPQPPEIGQGAELLDPMAVPPPPTPFVQPPASAATGGGAPARAATARGARQPDAAAGCPNGSSAAAGLSCGDAYLATLDQHLGSLYSESWARTDGIRRAQLLRSQDRFVARLDSCRSDACRRSVYQDRMREVRDITAGKWQPPKLALSGNADAGKLDRHLRVLFNQSWAEADAAKRALLLRSHNRFLERLESCRSDDCANGAYLARMREVSDIMTPEEMSSQ